MRRPNGNIVIMLPRPAAQVLVSSRGCVPELRCPNGDVASTPCVNSLLLSDHLVVFFLIWRVKSFVGLRLCGSLGLSNVLLDSHHCWQGLSCLRAVTSTGVYTHSKPGGSPPDVLYL